MSSCKPWFVLVAGINGAGKSTFAQDRDTLARDRGHGRAAGQRGLVRAGCPGTVGLGASAAQVAAASENAVNCPHRGPRSTGRVNAK